MEKDEFYNDFFEEVKIGIECIYCFVDVIVFFDLWIGGMFLL